MAVDITGADLVRAAAMLGAGIVDFLAQLASALLANFRKMQLQVAKLQMRAHTQQYFFCVIGFTYIIHGTTLQPVYLCL